MEWTVDLDQLTARVVIDSDLQTRPRDNNEQRGKRGTYLSVGRPRTHTQTALGTTRSWALYAGKGATSNNGIHIRDRKHAQRATGIPEQPYHQLFQAENLEAMTTTFWEADDDTPMGVSQHYRVHDDLWIRSSRWKRIQAEGQNQSNGQLQVGESSLRVKQLRASATDPRDLWRHLVTQTRRDTKGTARRYIDCGALSH